MRKRFIYAILVISLVVSVVAAACAAPKPTSTPIPTATPGPTAPTAAVGPTATPRPTATVGPTATPSKVFKWRAMIPEKTASPGVERWAELVGERSGGRIKIDVFQEGEHPLQWGDYMVGIRDRLTEVGFLGTDYEYTTDPLIGALDLPLMQAGGGGGMEEYLAMFDALRPLFYDPVAEKYNSIPLLTYSWGTPAPTTRSKWTLSFDDFKGQKLRVYSQLMGDMVAALGGVPLSIPWGEAYTSVQRGVADGLVMTPQVNVDVGFFEVARYFTLGNWFQSAPGLAVNRDVFNELPPDLQAIVLESAKEAEAYQRNWISEVELSKLWQGIMKYGVKVSAASPAFEVEARKKVQPIYDKYIAQVGPQGADVLKKAEEFHQQWVATHK